MKEPQRLSEIDVMRGLLVLLVVFGHVIQQFQNNLGPVWRQLIIGIYSFHMPVFAIVAGLCMQKVVAFQKGGERLDYVRGRALRLLVPYFVWGLVYFGLRACFSNLARVPYENGLAWMFPLGYSPSGASWFLWTLFVSSALVCLLGRWIARPWVVLALGAGTVLFRLYVPYTYYLPSSVYYVPLYVFVVSAGVCLRVHYGAVSLWLRNPFCLLLSLLPFVAVQWIIQANWKPWFPWYVLASVTAGAVFLSLALQIVRLPARAYGWLTLLGTEAMAIYMLGEPIKVAARQLLIKCPLPMALPMTAMMILMIVGAIVLNRFVLKRSAWASLLLLGVVDRKGMVHG